MDFCASTPPITVIFVFCVHGVGLFWAVLCGVLLGWEPVLTFRAQDGPTTLMTMCTCKRWFYDLGYLDRGTRLIEGAINVVSN